MVSVDELVKRRHALKISASDLALVIGMHGSGLTRIESGNVDSRISTLNRISAGLDTIEENRHAIECGAIILDEMEFKNTIFNAMIPILESREERGEFVGNPKILTDVLVQQIYEKITKTEE